MNGGAPGIQSLSSATRQAEPTSCQGQGLTANLFFLSFLPPYLSRCLRSSVPQGPSILGVTDKWFCL